MTVCGKRCDLVLNGNTHPRTCRLEPGHTGTCLPGYIALAVVMERTAKRLEPR